MAANSPNWHDWHGSSIYEDTCFQPQQTEQQYDYMKQQYREDQENRATYIGKQFKDLPWTSHHGQSASEARSRTTGDTTAVSWPLPGNMTVYSGENIVSQHLGALAPQDPYWSSTPSSVRLSSTPTQQPPALHRLLGGMHLPPNTQYSQQGICAAPRTWNSRLFNLSDVAVSANMGAGTSRGSARQRAVTPCNVASPSSTTAGYQQLRKTPIAASASPSAEVEPLQTIHNLAEYRHQRAGVCHSNKKQPLKHSFDQRRNDVDERTYINAPSSYPHQENNYNNENVQLESHAVSSRAAESSGSRCAITTVIPTDTDSQEGESSAATLNIEQKNTPKTLRSLLLRNIENNESTNTINVPTSWHPRGFAASKSSNAPTTVASSRPNARVETTARGVDKDPNGSTRTAMAVSTTSRSSDVVAIPHVPASLPTPCGHAPSAGYEFELNHDENLRELHRQKQWACTQLRSCNENNRFRHTQTTACIVAVNGHIVGPYSPESLRCYGTNSEIAGLRVTMTVYEGNASDLGSNKDNSSDRGVTDSEVHMSTLSGGTLVLRHQIILSHPHCYRPAATSSPYPSSLLPITARVPASMASVGPPTSSKSPVWSTRPSVFTNTLSTAAAEPTLHLQMATTAETKKSDRSNDKNVDTRNGTSDTATPAANAAAFRHGRSHYQHHQGRRYLFATTTIPLRSGVPARPGYRPLDATAAVDRIRQWGGRPDQGVFGNAWLIHLPIEPGHVQHVVDAQVMEQITRLTTAGTGAGMAGHGRGANGIRSSAGASAAAAATAGSSASSCMHAVNQHMARLATQESTLSILLSNHPTQKRIARQCPDLAAMWLLAQDNL